MSCLSLHDTIEAAALACIRSGILVAKAAFQISAVEPYYSASSTHPSKYVGGSSLDCGKWHKAAQGYLPDDIVIGCVSHRVTPLSIRKYADTFSLSV